MSIGAIVARPQLASQLQSITAAWPVTLLLGDRVVHEQLARVMRWQWDGRQSNLWPLSHECDTLTITLPMPSHRHADTAVIWLHRCYLQCFCCAVLWNTCLMPCWSWWRTCRCRGNRFAMSESCITSPVQSHLWMRFRGLLSQCTLPSGGTYVQECFLYFIIELVECSFGC